MEVRATLIVQPSAYSCTHRCHHAASAQDLNPTHESAFTRI